VRGCLFTVVLGVAVLAGVTVYVVPHVAEGAIKVAMTAAGFRADETDVRVHADPPYQLLGLKAGTVTIRATGVSLGTLTASSMDLTLTDVDLRARTARKVSGVLLDAVASAQEGPVAIPRIDLSGDSGAIDATAFVDGTTIERLVAQRVAIAAGVEPTAVRLREPNVLTIVMSGLSVSGDLVVGDDGAIRLSIGSPFGVQATLLEDGATPLKLSAIQVRGDRVVLEGALDATVLFG
jgi:hypothetical protein